MRTTKLKFNPDKTGVLLMDSVPGLGNDVLPIWERAAIPPKSPGHKLGVLFHPALLLEPQL